MKINSRATNLRHLQDALAALCAVAAVATEAPSPPRAETDLIRAAARALAVGATPREIRAASGRDETFLLTARCAYARGVLQVEEV